MGRKSISNYKLKKLKKFLSDGKTSNEISELLKVSTATVSNYRAYFKKKGESSFSKKNDVFTNLSQKNKAKQPSKSNGPSSLISSSSKYKYVINGTSINFKQKPKSLIIGKGEFIVEI
tara:strand:+ start:519 stop:872 length:354 start_codon:yes stop_codon:yes gene_type:complete